MNVFTFTANTIFTSEVFEDIPAIKFKLTDVHGNFLRRKLFVFRSVIWTIVVCVTLSTENVTRVLDFSGSIFTPIISYYSPVSLPTFKHAYN